MSKIELTQEEEQMALEKALQMKKEIAGQAVIDAMSEAEKLPEVQVMMAVIQGGQKTAKAVTGRYLGQNDMHFEVVNPKLKGVRVYSMQYETPEKEQGYNLVFEFVNRETGLKFAKTIPGEGPNPEEKDWSLITEE